MARCSPAVPRPFFTAASIPPDVPRNEPVLVGVSGGRDSVALLHWLKGEGFGRLIVCHLDHGLRAGSREDAAFVRSLAGEWGLPCETARANVAALATRKKQSIETAARHARHTFFAKCAKQHGTSRVMLAHHADDQVETFLFNLLRGAGPGGLAGMAAVGAVGTLTLIRPFLGIWREEIDAYCAAQALPWREDASNASRDHTRNRLRHDVLPMLSSAMGRDVRRALWRTAELLRAEDEVMAHTASEAFPTGKELEVAALRCLPVALQRRVIHDWLGKLKVPGIGYEEVETVRSLLGMRVAKVNLPAGACARRRAGRIFLARQDAG